MKIGIDISQIVYEGTGVSRYVKNMVTAMVKGDRKNHYVFFGSSMRRQDDIRKFYETIKTKNTALVLKPFPPTLLHILWNVLHVVPVEFFIGDVDVFWSSDWTQPPLKKAKGVTTVHDIMVHTAPESFPASIMRVQKKRLTRVANICHAILCDSKTTKEDVQTIMRIPEKRLYVVYPGFNLGER